MTQRIRRALVSVSDKSGLVPFARALRRLGVQVISTGGTAELLRTEGIPVTEMSRFTGFPEILGGRVKTLHPKVHGAILARRRDREHQRQIRRLGIQPIDLVVVNLYPFEETARKRAVSLPELLEQIDIGGVALLRSAAKNFPSVAVVSRPSQYPQLLQEMNRRRGLLSDATRRKLAVEAFAETAYYDALIHQVLSHRAVGAGHRQGASYREWPDHLVLAAKRKQLLRYGENPHQAGVWYEWPGGAGADGSGGAGRQLHGKELSFNNLLDLDAAAQLAAAFRRPCAAVVKHNDPCGVACASRLSAAFRRAFACDPLSAFGGIVGLNRKVDAGTARALLSAGFLECVVAPGYQAGALKLLRRKKNLRIIQAALPRGRRRGRCVEFKQITGGLLVQEPDRLRAGPSGWRVATSARPTAAQRKDLLFAWTVARFVRSNAIVVARQEQTVGIGAGQTSRVDSVRLALRKAGRRARGSVLASDGFFPKPDGPRAALRSGIRAIVQPGGSVQDPAVIRVAERARIPMLLTGERHFRH